ncbi:MAG: hypothetical protein ACR2PL_21845 [Dehalococcoidia bacterium]
MSASSPRHPNEDCRLNLNGVQAQHGGDPCHGRGVTVALGRTDGLLPLATVKRIVR